MSFEPAVLPDRTQAAEDTWLTSWIDHDDQVLLVDAVRLAIQARRPRLAARLFQLVDERIDIEPGSDLDRAARAARMLLVKAPSPQHWVDLEDAWREVRKDRVRRIKRRWRQQLAGRNGTVRRHDRRRR